MKNEFRYFGVDIDTKDTKTNKRALDRINRITKQCKVVATRKGFHYHCKLDEPIDLTRYIEIRDFCGDDPLRLVKDIKKILKGFSEYDLLFTKKWRGW